MIEFCHIYSCPSLLLVQLYPRWFKISPNLSAQRIEEACLLEVGISTAGILTCESSSGGSFFLVDRLEASDQKLLILPLIFNLLLK